MAGRITGPHKVHGNAGSKHGYAPQRGKAILAHAQIPEAMPMEYEHGPDCWRSPLHHDCAVALIEELMRK